eukprot:scaffold162476_cov35-Tisochrysis_lutea.AAC.2
MSSTALRFAFMRTVHFGQRKCIANCGVHTERKAAGARGGGEVDQGLCEPLLKRWICQRSPERPVDLSLARSVTKMERWATAPRIGVGKKGKNGVNVRHRTNTATGKVREHFPKRGWKGVARPPESQPQLLTHSCTLRAWAGGQPDGMGMDWDRKAQTISEYSGCGSAHRTTGVAPSPKRPCCWLWMRRRYYAERIGCAKCRAVRPYR